MQARSISRFIFNCLLLLATLTARAQTSERLQLNLGTGYVRQDMRWSIAGNIHGQNPNVYSELHWKGLGGQLFNVDLQWNVRGSLLLEGQFRHTFIRSGTVTDNDYKGDNRTQPVYDELFNANKGYDRKANAGVGFKVVNNKRITFVPFLGYGFTDQSLFILDRDGQFPGLKSTYLAGWKGPYIKAAASFTLVPRLTLLANATYNQVAYNAHADWNLIQTFQHPVSYRHNANGYGLDAGAGLCFEVNKYLRFNLKGGYFKWKTGNGVDELFLSDGETDKTQLNGIDRSGYLIGGGLAFKYL